MAKFHGNILSASKNIAKSFGGSGYFFTHTVHTPTVKFPALPSAFHFLCP